MRLENLRVDTAKMTKKEEEKKKRFETNLSQSAHKLTDSSFVRLLSDRSFNL